jgi:hypothetical protein
LSSAMAVLKDRIIAVTGALEHDTTQIKKWIEANGGRYSPNVRRGITHLITGKDAWRQSSDAVQAANKLGVFVVTFEWLEDSLHKRRKLAEKQYTWEHITQLKRRERQMKKLGPQASQKQFENGCDEIKKNTGSGTSKSRRPRVVVPKPKKSTSLLTADWHVPFVPAAEALEKKREKREAAKAKREAEEAAAKKTKETNTNRAASTAPSSSTADNVASPTSATSHALSTTSFQPAPPAPGVQAKKTSLKDLYHYYLDSTGFEYKIILTRCNLRANEITRYRLSILESHTKPHVYCTLIEYFPPGAGHTASSGGACIQALLDFEKTFHESTNTDASLNDNQEDKTEVLPASLPLPQQGIHHHPESERLRALLAPPTASPVTPPADKPYKNLIAPMSSDFATAWRAFRHAFRDLTLLSWEERFDITKVLYKTRASHFNLEPFVYMRPKDGLPIGLRVQQDGLFQNQTLAPLAEDGSTLSHPSPQNRVRENDDGYVYNTFALPGLSAPLGPGIIGQAVARDIKAAREAAEEAKRRADEAEEARLRKLGLPRKFDGKKKPNYSRPLFNGVNGRPTTDAWGNQKRGERGVGEPYGSGLLGGGAVKQRRLFPSERKESW